VLGRLGEVLAELKSVPASPAARLLVELEKLGPKLTRLCDPLHSALADERQSLFPERGGPPA
jgi:hypothetical protein